MTLMPFVGLLALLIVMLGLMKSLLHSFERFFVVFSRQGRKAKELFFHFTRMICFGSHFLSSFQNCSKCKGFDACAIDNAYSHDTDGDHRPVGTTGVDARSDEDAECCLTTTARGIFVPQPLQNCKSFGQKLATPMTQHGSSEGYHH